MSVPDVVLLPKSCREVSLATFSSLIPLRGSLSRRPLAVSTSIKDRQVRIHANYSANPAKWEHSARSARGCLSNTFCLSFQCIKLPPVMTSHANYDVLHSFPLIRNWSIPYPGCFIFLLVAGSPTPFLPPTATEHPQSHPPPPPTHMYTHP